MEIILKMPTGEKDEDNKEIFKDKVYVAPEVKARMVRKALELTQNISYSELKPADLDTQINYVCELFGNQFTVDDVYDGLAADKLIPTIWDCVNGVIGEMGAKLEQFPNAPAGR